MASLEPYLLFKIFLFVLFSGYLIYTILDIIFWFRNLSVLSKKYIVRSLLSLRFSAIKTELFIILLLSPILTILLWINLRIVY